MLSSLLLKLSRHKRGPSKWLRNQAEVYIDLFNDFDYDFHKNGESVVIQRLSFGPGSTLFDVGANVGDWSAMAAAAFPGATIHAFELSQRTRAVLTNRLSAACHVIPACALGPSNGELQYKDYGDESTINTLVESTYHDGRSSFTHRVANIVTGDDYMAAHGIERIDLLKIDVEGFEYPVLEGFRNALEQGRISVIQFEYGYANGDAGHLMKDFYTLLEKSGYVIGKIWTAGVLFSPFKYPMNNFDSGPNYLAVRHTDTALIESLRSRE